MSLYWRKPDGTYQMVDEVLKYHPLAMVSVLSAGDQLLLPAENLMVL
jgi:hypothetical protein